jgi:hypothetical protein
METITISKSVDGVKLWSIIVTDYSYADLARLLLKMGRPEVQIERGQIVDVRT